MFGNMYKLINDAPYLIFIAFVGSFLLTFTTVKVSQSDVLYDWLLGKLEVWKSKQARKIRLEMTTDLNSFLRGRKEQELSPREQRLYYRMLESYYEKVERLYPSSKTEGGAE
jgi:hypothetical protein